MGWGNTRPALQNILTFLFIFQSFFLCYSFSVSKHKWIYTKESIKFLNRQLYWYFQIMGWWKTGPACSPPPPPKCSDISIYLLVFGFMLVFHCILTRMNQFQRENQALNQQLYWYIYINGVGKDWASPSPPSPLQNVPIFLFFSVFHFMLLIHCIWRIMNNILKRESSFQTDKCIGTSTFFPPTKMFWPFYFSLSFGLWYSFTVSEQLWMIYLKERIKLLNQIVYLYFYIMGWGKTGPARSSPLKMFWLFIPPVRSI